jgi:hypothetical protein
MKHLAIAALLAAVFAAGCGESGPEQSETQDESKAKPEANRRVKIVADDTDRRVGAPGFFSGSARGGRRVLARDPDDIDEPEVPDVKPPETPEPVKRAEPNLVKPDAEAERKIRLAKLYIDNAASAASAERSKFLLDKALVILKEVVSKYPKDPAVGEAKKLLAKIQTPQ